MQHIIILIFNLYYCELSSVTRNIRHYFQNIVLSPVIKRFNTNVTTISNGHHQCMDDISLK